MVIHVKGFGKIKSADINIGSLTVFVGENNSGKTYLMQLIYHVLETLIDLRGLSKFLDEEITQINQSNWNQINIAVNKWLQANRKMIVKEAFLSTISITELSVDFDEIEDEYTLNLLPPPASNETMYSYEITNKTTKKLVSTHFVPCYYDKTSVLVSSILSYVLPKHGRIATKPLFLPSSRVGLMLLYRDVFASRKPQDMMNLSMQKSKNTLGLTCPVYDYLNFLQTYRYDSDSKRNKKIIDFIGERLIDGSFDFGEHAILYKPQFSKKYFPAHLSSSMINELAPLVMMLTNIVSYDSIFYDEIETCLHPLKQIEMARLVVRLVNSNYKMVISTHSDTMAIALNNLILLSHMSNRDEIAEKLGYSKDDFFQKNDIHVYQFTCGKGKTTVTEIEMYPNINIGYDFELFNQSNNKLYNDARIIMEDADE